MFRLRLISRVYRMVERTMDVFLQALEKMKGGKNLILCHDQADSDAVGAAYAISRFLDGDIGVPSCVAAHAQGLVRELGITMIVRPSVEQYEHVIIVDAAHAAQLTGCLPAKYWLIDHHPANGLIEGAEGGLYDPVSSTCQLVYRLLREAGFLIDRKIALALAAGIMTDTIHFHKGDAESFRIFGELLACGKLTYEDIKKLYLVDERQDRGAIIDAALRARKFVIGEYQILISEIERNIPTFAARALFDLGADISIVGYQQGEKVDLRVYLRQDLMEKEGLHAIDILRNLSVTEDRKVWGYQHFAGYHGKGELDLLLQETLKQLEHYLGKTKG
jgi:bifunctional oligoribonuclease and PAP phosphatase NrnA